MIFHLVEQFKESYYQEKHEKTKISDESEQSSARPSISPLAHPIITSEFKPQEKYVNIIVNLNREDDSMINGSSKCDSGEKERSSNNDKFLSDHDPQLNILDL